MQKSQKWCIYNKDYLTAKYDDILVLEEFKIDYENKYLLDINKS